MDHYNEKDPGEGGKTGSGYISTVVVPDTTQRDVGLLCCAIAFTKTQSLYERVTPGSSMNLM